MSPIRSFTVLACASMLAGATALLACETETPTSAVVDNHYPAAPDGGDPSLQTVVYRTWWEVTYFADPIVAGGTSTEQRSVPASEFAYALLAPGWDPASGTPPATLIPVKSRTALTASRGEVLHIAVSDQTFAGDCKSGQKLSQEEADFITQRIFPGEFADVAYDASTCTSIAIPAEEAGIDASPDTGTDAGPG